MISSDRRGWGRPGAVRGPTIVVRKSTAQVQAREQARARLADKHSAGRGRAGVLATTRTGLCQGTAVVTTTWPRRLPTSSPSPASTPTQPTLLS